MKGNFPEWLRKEANEVKGCFTTFSFQAIALSGVVLGAIANYQPQQPFAGLAGILVIVVVITVSRIGNYKYGTANRHFGYQLLWERICNNNDEDNKKLISGVGWEEALCAWRVVQATMFDEIYYTKLNTKRLWLGLHPKQYNRVKKGHKSPGNTEGEKFWFKPSSIVGGEAGWYPGRYLYTMQRILHRIAAFSTIPLIIMSIQLQTLNIEQATQPGQNLGAVPGPMLEADLFGIRWAALVAGIVALVIIYILRVHILQINARRKLLEHGLLNIHSCSVVWHVVLVAHNRAINRLDSHTRYDQSQYLKELSDEANVIKKYSLRIFEWLEDPDKAWAKCHKPDDSPENP